MVRIQDSQSWYRGSIPLSTTVFFMVFAYISRETRAGFFIEVDSSNG